MPGLDGVAEISNFGRVKSKRRFVVRKGNGGFWKRDEILKPQISCQVVLGGKRKIYRLAVIVSLEGRKFNCSIARLVYYLFVKKFDLDDPKIKVSIKDEDPFHITPDNLFLTSPDVYMKKAYKLNRRKRESFGNKGRLINQYNLEGKWMNSFLSINQAATSIKASSGFILRALNELGGVAAGYLALRE